MQQFLQQPTASAPVRRCHSFCGLGLRQVPDPGSHVPADLSADSRRAGRPGPGGIGRQTSQGIPGVDSGGNENEEAGEEGQRTNGKPAADVLKEVEDKKPLDVVMEEACPSLLCRSQREWRGLFLPFNRNRCHCKIEGVVDKTHARG